MELIFYEGIHSSYFRSGCFTSVKLDLWNCDVTFIVIGVGTRSSWCECNVPVLRLGQCEPEATKI